MELILKQWIDEEKSLSSFRSAIRANIRGLWNGSRDTIDFEISMRSIIEREFRRAWIQGAAECGIKADELTQAELSELERMTNEQFPFLPGFAADIETGSKANNGRLGPHFERGEMWINRYDEVRNRGKSMACRDSKLKWELGAAEHCRSCLALNGKVKRASFWNNSGILPRTAGASFLECRGYRCACSLVPTDEPISRGRMPSLP